MKIRFNVLWLWLSGFLLVSNAYIGAMYVTVKIEINSAKITVEMETEAGARKNTTITGKNVDSIRDTLFKTPNEGVSFKYDNQGANYSGLIDNITDPLQHEEVKKAFADFQDYVAQNMRNVVAAGTKFNAKVDISSKSPLAATNKDVYKHIQKLGEVLGIEMPDPDAGLFSSACKALSNKWVKRAIYAGLAVGGIALLYSKWGQWSGILGTGTEKVKIGLETGSECAGAVQKGLKTSAQQAGKLETWLKTPSKPKAPTPTRGPLVKATPQITPTPELSTPGNIPDSQPLQLTPTPEIFENMPVSSNTP